MGFDLIPRNKAVGEFRIGAYAWPSLLDQGIGWPLGRYPGLLPGQYIHTVDRTRRGTPDTNDGYRVTATEAREMAKIAWYVSAQHRAWREHWETLPTSTRELVEQKCHDSPSVYRVPPRWEFIDLTERFADWAERSGGFRIK